MFSSNFFKLSSEVVSITFFNLLESKFLKKKYGKFDLITANNVCAHVDKLNNFTKGVKNILKTDGVFIFEVGYFYDVYKNKNAPNEVVNIQTHYESIYLKVDKKITYLSFSFND